MVYWLQYALGEGENLEDFLLLLGRVAGVGESEYSYLAGCQLRNGRREVDAVMCYPRGVTPSEVRGREQWRRRGARGDVISAYVCSVRLTFSVRFYRLCEQRLRDEYPEGLLTSSHNVHEVLKCERKVKQKRAISRTLYFGRKRSRKLE